MSTKVCGIIELNKIDIQRQEKTLLYFFIVDKATSSGIGIILGPKVFSGFLQKRKHSLWEIPFELADDPTDVNAECLFTGDGIEMYSSGIRIDTGESLSSRMTRVQNFLENLLMSKLIKMITLDINFIDMDEDTVEIIEIKANDFCKKMIELYQHKDNWTPVVRVVIKHDR